MSSREHRGAGDANHIETPTAVLHTPTRCLPMLRVHEVCMHVIQGALQSTMHTTPCLLVCLLVILIKGTWGQSEPVPLRTTPKLSAKKSRSRGHLGGGGGTSN